MPPQFGDPSADRGSVTRTDLRLRMSGPARLEFQGKTVRIRRKSLAILYYLAIEGPTRRQVLADLLWEQVDSSQNLRVELYDLRKTLREFIERPFGDSSDPLTLPEEIGLESTGGSGERLEGLEGIAPAFQAWLEVQRAKNTAQGATWFVQRDLVEALARKIRLPYVLFLSGQPDSGHYQFAVSLAARLALPISEGAGAGTRGVRFLRDSVQPEPELVQQILMDRGNLWIVERASFSEDSDLLLALRSAMPPQRVSYLELPPLSWRELRSQLGAGVPFAEAADLYLSSGGHPGFMRELQSLAGSGDAGTERVFPQRIRAAYQLAARQLPPAARFALERASVHPGPLTDGLLGALELEEHLVELERRNWLVFDGGWRFNGSVARSVIHLSLPAGQARLYHQRAARQLEQEGKVVAAAYHRSVSQTRIDWNELMGCTRGWAQRLATFRNRVSAMGQGRGRRSAEPAPEPALTVPRVRAVPEEEYPLLESSVFGSQVEVQSAQIAIARQPFEMGASGVEWQLAGGAGLLHLRGKALARSVLDIGLGGDAYPLKLEFQGPSARAVSFAGVESPECLPDGTVLMPLGEEIDCYLYFEDSYSLRLSTLAEAAVLELTLTAYRSTVKGMEAPQGVLAYDIVAATRPGLRLSPRIAV